MATSNVTVALASPMQRFLVAVVSGVLAIGLLWYYVEQTLEEKSGGKRVPVLVAIKAVKHGERIDDAAITVQEIPTAYLHGSAVREADKGKIVGRKVYRHIADHDQISWTDFDPPETERASLVALTKGMRAYPVQMADALRKARLVKTGDVVDVVFHFTLPSGSVAITLFQRITVLEQRDDVAVLALSPDQAEHFVFANAHGQYTLVVRNRDDTEQKRLSPMSFRELLDGYVDLRVAPSGAGAATTKQQQQMLKILETVQQQRGKQ